MIEAKLEKNKTYCDVQLIDNEQILMIELVDVIKTLALYLNKDQITILEILECYFFLEEENRKKIVIEKLFKKFNKECNLHTLQKDELYLYNKKECVLHKNKNNSEYVTKSASKKKKVSEPYKGEKKSKPCKGENKQRIKNE